MSDRIDETREGRGDARDEAPLSRYVLTTVVILVIAALSWFAIQAVRVPEPAAFLASSTTGPEPLVVGPVVPAPGAGPGNAARVDPAWASRVADATGIPTRALLGYAGAELAMEAEVPGCRIRWNTLAALGGIESAHGTHAGSALGDDGVARPGIFGIDLTGASSARVVDTDGGIWDGRAEIDRAVGPMQFIPATWEQWGADGNGDGVRDPQQIDDAALAAARYLCHYGDLSVPAAWREAVFAYNHLDSYVDEVASTADLYAHRAVG